jgi:hypothetical protein
MKTISELLTILRDSEDLFKKRCSVNGLCKLSTAIMDVDRITWSEYVELTNFIDDNRPDRRSKHFYIDENESAYYWPQGMWEPREAWLDTQIIKQKKIEKKTHIT